MGAGEVIYLDIVLGVNLVMDYIALWSAVRLARVRCRGRRVFWGAAIGALYSVLPLFLAGTVWVAIPVKLALPFLMVYLAMGKPSPRLLIRGAGYFYALNFAMGGVILGALMTAGYPDGSFSGDHFPFTLGLSYQWLLPGIIVAVALGYWGPGIIFRGVLERFYHLSITIRFGNESLMVRAMLDTGNRLSDPLTGWPVVIVEFDALKELLPEEICVAYAAKDDIDVQKVIMSLARSSWSSRVRLLPFTSIGRARGMLLGLRPDEVIILSEKGAISRRDVLVGVYQQQLSRERTYRALLNPDMLPTNLGI